MKKKSIYVILAITTLLIVSTILISFGFVNSTVHNGDSGKKQSFISRKMEITYSDGNQSLTDDSTIFKPGTTLTKNFTVKNTGNVDFIYSIKLTDLVNNFKRKVVYPI